MKTPVSVLPSFSQSLDLPMKFFYIITGLLKEILNKPSHH